MATQPTYIRLNENDKIIATLESSIENLVMLQDTFNLRHTQTSIKYIDYEIL